MATIKVINLQCIIIRNLKISSIIIHAKVLVADMLHFILRAFIPVYKFSICALVHNLFHWNANACHVWLHVLYMMKSSFQRTLSLAENSSYKQKNESLKTTWAVMERRNLSSHRQRFPIFVSIFIVKKGALKLKWKSPFFVMFILPFPISAAAPSITSHPYSPYSRMRAAWSQR